MKNTLRKTLSLLLGLTVLFSALPAASSEAYGQQLVARERQLHEGAVLYTETYWSSYYADLRQEYYLTYTPGEAVAPKVTFGSYVTERTTTSSAARNLERDGYRVVAGVNADFFDGNGTPTGLLVSGGHLFSSDGANYAVGFTAEGEAVIGMPGLSLTGSVNGEGDFRIAGLNKARSSKGGIYAYTYDFNAAHTTGTTEAGVDVILSPADDEEAIQVLEVGALRTYAQSLGVAVEDLSDRERQEALRGLPEAVTVTPAIGETALYIVDQVIDRTSGATAVAPGQLVLSTNLKSAEWERDYLHNMRTGDLFGLTVTARDEMWNDVTEAVGGLYLLVENGQARTGLGTDNAPRTAVGVTAAGEVILYAVDGRRSGYSVGSSLSVLAQRMEELGCETAICFDGGGSTTALASLPDADSAGVLNSPSDNSERRVTSHLFLVADGEPTGRADHVYLDAASPYILAGSTVPITAAVVDTAYFPTNGRVTLSASDGDVNDLEFTAPDRGGDVRITGSARGAGSAELELTVIDAPEELRLLRGTTRAVSLTLQPGEQVDLTAAAYYRHLKLLSADTDFTWSVTEDVGDVDEEGVFTAGQFGGTGTLTVSKGRINASIPVSVAVTTHALETLEDFEGDISGYSGHNVTLSRAEGDAVRYGLSALRMDYHYESDGAGLQLGWTLPKGYRRLTFSVCGDGSGNTLSVYDDTGTMTPLTTLDFTGWRQVSVTLPEACTSLAALVLEGSTTRGTLYFDQFVASYADVIDNTPPAVDGTLVGSHLTASAVDNVDGNLETSHLSLTCDGKSISFTLDSGGNISADLTSCLSDGKAHRISLTAWDASGNRSRKSWDVTAAAGVTAPFVDNVNPDGSAHWAAECIQYLYDQNLITGYEEKGKSYVKPDKHMTRAEFAVMLFRYLGLNAADYSGLSVPFADLNKIDAWALDAAKAMYALGIMQGSGTADGRVYFEPQAVITRAQAITMLGRLQEKGFPTAELTDFKDARDVPDWALSHMQTMVAQGILSGSDGRLNPNASMTRAQACKVLYMMR